jgi:hypothetical protein
MTAATQTTPDQQAYWDAELVSAFRARLEELSAVVRNKQTAETDARVAYKEAVDERRAEQVRMTSWIEGEGRQATDQRYVETLQAISASLDRAEEYEKAARRTLGQATDERRLARYKLENHIHTFLEKYPLFGES